MAEVINADREVTVTTGEGNTYGYGHHTIIPRSASSAFSPLRQRPQSTLGLRPRARSASNLLSRSDQRVQFHDDTVLARRSSAQDGFAELIDFLRNHAPPSDNFMSIPDEVDGDDRGKWALLRRLGKRKGLSRGPQQIRLPDSAVSGTTIGGHRHIAISIPLAASPFGQNPRSQYPIIQSGRPITTRYAPTRAFVNEKGVVTVLQGITEARETQESHLPTTFSQYRLPSTSQDPGGVNSAGSFTPMGQVRNSSSPGRPPEYNTQPLRPRPLRTPPRDSIRRIENPAHETPYASYERPSVERTGSPTQRGYLPLRASSLTGGRLPFTEHSIDAIMSQQHNITPARFKPVAPVSRPISQAESGNSGQSGRSGRESLSKSIITNSENDPIVAEAEAMRTARSTPLLVGDSPKLKPTKMPSLPNVTVITDNPLGTSQTPTPTPTRATTSSPAPSIRSTQSRRDKVREKKRRDMEAMKMAAQRKQAQAVAKTDDKMAIPVPPAKSKLRPKSGDVERAKAKAKAKAMSPVPESPHGPKMCPIMVVADVEPSPPLVNGHPHTPAQKQDSKQISKQASKQSVRSSQQDESTSKEEPPATPAAAPTTVVYLRSSNNSTPLKSPNGSIRGPSLDRTSLLRRREWNARAQERRANDEERKAQELKSAALRAKTRKLIKESTEPWLAGLPPMEQEVLRRYEAYREYRIREMERRVRRLERNGDVWLRALIPVLDNLNRTLANTPHQQAQTQQQQQQPQPQQHRAQGWFSDEDASSSFEGRGRSLGYRRQQDARDEVVRRSATSERQFLEQLAKKREELAKGSGDDMSGFDSLEPLMRELAGRSRLSFEARRTLGVDEDGAILGV